MIDYGALSKTLLKIYNYINLFTDKIDKTVNSVAMSGNGILCSSMPTQYIFDRITELTSKKRLLINIKIHTVNSLKKLDIEYRKILLLKYKERFSAEKSAKLLNISTRTFFRKHDKAIVSFANFIKQSTLSEDDIIDCLNSEKWIYETYLSFTNFNETDNYENIKFSKTLVLDKLLDISKNKDKKLEPHV